jgi:MerR family transcriptional regulator, thiopeptide resistance regulator
MVEQSGARRIGELAERVGITVRTLHHYDQLGLLSPSSRTAAGHRYYTSDDVEKLHRIIALRNCGLTLEEVGRALSANAGSGLADLLRRQLEVVDERIRQATGLRVRLNEVLSALSDAVEPSTTEILNLIEETNTMNQPLTVERFAELKAERARHVREMSDEEFMALRHKMEQTWAGLSKEEQTALVAYRRATLPANVDNSPK